MEVSSGFQARSGQHVDVGGVWSYTYTPIAHSKMVMIPKKDQRKLQPSAFRPIAAQSAWWIAWASTWLRSQWKTSWVRSSFPKNIAGGIPSALGPEVMAATLDYQLAGSKFAISLDLKHAFDTVHPGLMEKVLRSILPEAHSRWIALAFGHWKKTQRWIFLDAHVCPEPLTPDIGLCQEILSLLSSWLL